MGYFSYLPRVAVRTSTFRQNNVEPSVIARNITNNELAVCDRYCLIFQNLIDMLIIR